ncbi:hypothetical protein ACP4OV_003426 [Aristida adscensionis]
MGSPPRGLLLLGVVGAALMAAVAAAGDASSVVVGLATCADCASKNMNTETVFRGLQVAIKCKNSNGEYESMGVGELDGSGAFGVPLAADLRGADCLAQLHSAAAGGAPCAGQEPSRIVPAAAGGTTFVAVAGKAARPSAECGSAAISDPLHLTRLSDHFHKDHHHHFFDHFHKKQQPPPATPMPEPKPQPQPQPQPTPMPMPTPMPTYGPPAPICTPPAKH